MRAECGCPHDPSCPDCGPYRISCPYKVRVTERLDGSTYEVDLPCALWAGHQGECAAETPKEAER